MTESAKSPPKSARRRARELIVQGLYSHALNEQSVIAIENHLRQAQGFHKADSDYFHTTLNQLIDNKQFFYESLTPYLDRPLAELTQIEQAILLLACYEFKTQLDVPYRVVINEAIEVAKIYGSNDGYKYINGVLDRIATLWRKVEIDAIKGQEKSIS